MRHSVCRLDEFLRPLGAFTPSLLCCWWVCRVAKGCKLSKSFPKFLESFWNVPPLCNPIRMCMHHVDIFGHCITKHYPFLERCIKLKIVLKCFASWMRPVCMPAYGAKALYDLDGSRMKPWGFGVFGNMVSGKSIFKCPFFQALQSVAPTGWWHATVGVQQDPETPDDQQAEKHQQHPNERKRRLLLQAQRIGHDITPAHGRKAVVIVNATHVPRRAPSSHQ